LTSRGKLRLTSRGKSLREPEQRHPLAGTVDWAAPSLRHSKLQRALGSRTVIDQAIGLLRGRNGGSAEEAFDELRRISQSENVKLAVIAPRVLDQAVRHAQARRQS
jgi:ANTAR domain